MSEILQVFFFLGCLDGLLFLSFFGVMHDCFLLVILSGQKKNGDVIPRASPCVSQVESNKPLCAVLLTSFRVLTDRTVVDVYSVCGPVEVQFFSRNRACRGLCQLHPMSSCADPVSVLSCLSCSSYCYCCALRCSIPLSPL